MNSLLLIYLVWGISVLIQIYYWAFVVRVPPVTSVPDLEADGIATAGVSVVVCVHRDVQKLERLLRRLSAQTFPLYEIVIVNDGPNPEIGRYLDHLLKEVTPFREGMDVFEGQQTNTESKLAQVVRKIDFDASTKIMTGKKAPLEKGIHAAQYPWLLLTDGDCVPGPDWISEMTSHLKPGIEIVLGFGPLLRKSGLLNLLQRFNNLLTVLQYAGAALRGKPYMGVGRNLLYHRALFDKVEGFVTHAHVVSGDDDLFVQSGATSTNTSVCLDAPGFVYSDAPATLSDWVHQKRRHLSASGAYTRTAKLQTALYSASWLGLWVGLPIIMCSSYLWQVSGILTVALFWFLFIRFSIRMRETTIIPWFPILAWLYCILILGFAFLLTLRAPKTWMKS